MTSNLDKSAAKRPPSTLSWFWWTFFTLNIYFKAGWIPLQDDEHFRMTNQQKKARKCGKNLQMTMSTILGQSGNGITWLESVLESFRRYS